MIERMKKVTVFSESGRKHQLLLALREFGVVHISNMVQKSESVDKLEKKNSEYENVVRAIEEYADKKNKPEAKNLSDSEFLKLHDSLTKALVEKERLKEENISLTQERERILPFGDFDPQTVKELEGEGIPLYFYTLSKKELDKLSKDEDVKYVRVSYSGKMFAIASVGAPLTGDVSATPFVLPKESLGSIEAKLLENKEKLERIDEMFRAANAYLGVYRKHIAIENEKITFEKASATVEDVDQIIFLNGYIPAAKAEEFKDFCKREVCAYLIDDPSDEDAPPTNVKNKGPINLIRPVFDMLGLVPGYREKDISLYFLLFLTLFFAMIIGDAGYGLIFVAIAALMNLKSRKCNTLNALIYVAGGATVVWGALTGTWFGSEWILKNIPLLQKFVIPSLTNFPGLFGLDGAVTQNAMMKFCFQLGAIHIGLACGINIVSKIKDKDLSLVADIGWFIDVVLLYLLVLFLVVGENAPMMVIACGVGLGFVLVCCFNAQGPGVPFLKGLGASLAGFFTTFLDTISAFSNIMSYIRLFAVGMASLAIAESFNDMAAPMLGGMALPAGILILVLGHLINLVMGLLSVVVHGVRLNVLEFSNQLGMEWSGYKYDPFSKKVADNK